MLRHRVKKARYLGLFLAPALLGCALFAPPAGSPALGTPKIFAFMIEPVTVKVGEVAVFSFQYEDREADVVEARLFQTEIKEFSYSQSFEPIVVDLREYFGQAIGRVQIPYRWDAEGIRLYELYVVDKKGNQSNRLRVRVTVRPS